MNRVFSVLALLVSLLFLAGQASAASSFLSDSNNPKLYAYILNPFNISISTSDHNALTNLQWSLSGHTINTNLSMANYWITNLKDPLSAQEAATKAYVDSIVAGGYDWSADIMNNATNASAFALWINTTVPTNYLNSIPNSYMQYQFWNSTNTSYALNATFNGNPYGWLNNTNNLSYVAWAFWNITNVSYVDWVHFNITNTSYALNITLSLMAWNQTNESYSTHAQLLANITNQSAWTTSTNTSLFNVLVSMLSGYATQAWVALQGYIAYGSWINQTNTSYMTYPAWNSTNSTYDTLTRTAMLYSAWNSTNTSYALNTTLATMAWNRTNESYVQWVYMNISNSTFSKVAWNQTNVTYMAYQYWNSTNATYNAYPSYWNSSNSSYMLYSAWNATNTTYPAINSTGWLNNMVNATILSFFKICNSTECTTNVGGGGGGAQETDPIFSGWQTGITLAAGASASASADFCVALGSGATASVTAAVAIGEDAIASNDYAIALAAGSQATGKAAVALGNYAVASGDFSTAIGYDADALNPDQIVLGTSDGNLVGKVQLDIYNGVADFQGNNINTTGYMNASIFNGAWNGSTAFMPYSSWNQTNTTYALNTTLASMAWNQTNVTYMAYQYWNSTNATYNAYPSYWNSSNNSYMLWSAWNSTNASYISLNATNWINNIINSTVGWFYNLYGNVIIAVTRITSPEGNFTSISANYGNISNLMPYAYWNSTNATYDALIGGASTNSSYDALLRTAMLYSTWNTTNTSYLLYSAWNSTNTTYALNATLSTMSWNRTNESYVQWVYMNVSNLTFSKVAWNQTNTTYALNTTLASMAWNQTNATYALNTTLSTVMWNTTNSSYGVINTTKWINNYGFNGTYASTNNLTIGNSGSSTFWNNGTWTYWM
jgi:hypothetical protein